MAGTSRYVQFAAFEPNLRAESTDNRYLGAGEQLTHDQVSWLVDHGWIDAIRTLHPEATIYTYWDYMRKRWERNAGLRIDHLLLNPPLAARLVAAGVDRAVRGRTGASDHAPAWIETR